MEPKIALLLISYQALLPQMPGPLETFATELSIRVQYSDLKWMLWRGKSYKK